MVDVISRQVRLSFTLEQNVHFALRDALDVKQSYTQTFEIYLIKIRVTKFKCLHVYLLATCIERKLATQMFTNSFYGVL